jgi:GMP synthase (glutamine-hydrolysing)
MGGPQTPAVTLQDCHYFDAKSEQILIASAINSGKAVIGVCLGAQLIGETLGAAFTHSPEKEIGKFPITLTAAAKANPLFVHFGETLAVGHWHNDMPGLTPEAIIIAHSAGCPLQIIAYSDRVYGFQCHMELTPELVGSLIAHSTRELSQAWQYPYVDDLELLRKQDYSEMNAVLWEFLDKLEESYKLGLTTQ